MTPAFPLNTLSYPLSLASEGSTFRILSVPVKARLARRLLLMGLLEETEWRVLRQHRNGAVVIERQARRLTLRAEFAAHIFGMITPES